MSKLNLFIASAAFMSLAGCAASSGGAADASTPAASGPIVTVPAGIIDEGFEKGVHNAEKAGFRDGLNYISFDDWAGKPIPAFVFVPKGTDLKTAPVMFMLHGARRGAVRYLKEWVLHAQKAGVIVIAPKFPLDIYKGSRRYNSGYVRSSKKNGNKLRPQEKWTFSAIDPLFEDVKNRLGNTSAQYTLYGHSAGSQFVHRFLFFKPDAKAKRIIAANAGWYTYPDLDIGYPYGLKDSFAREDALKKALVKEMIVILGDKDSDPNHKSLRRTPEALLQGPHRYARGLGFFSAGKKQAEKMNVTFGWKQVTVPGVAHSNGGIAARAIDFVK